ncbi:hypothetical protein DYB28_003710 [Aphanomyces astaci]|uniref:Uncharacterized protein n=1 Tax=Aphanomyces astaci TaxID=112090 RepID=A0A9X8HEH0_APHAT|nr:hypothetical protein DYB28_003710 [Aphanomyces astaci]
MNVYTRYGLGKLVAPDNINHFFLQPLERWQAIYVITEFVSGCFNQPTLRPYHTTPAPPQQSTNTAPRRLSERLSSAITSVQHVLLTSSHRISSSSPTSAALVLELSSKSTHFLRKALTDRTNDAGRPSIQPLKHIERIRKCRLATYCDLDPFDARSKLKVFNARAMLIPPVLYTDGPIAEGLHALAWVLLAVTVWRLSLARDAVRDASQMYHGLIRQTHSPPLPSRRRSNTVEVASLLQPPVSVSATVLRTEKQLRYYLVITQLKGLGVDLLYICPYLKASVGVVSVGKLSILACVYGILWVVLAFVSVVTITRSIPGFNDTRRVDKINLTDFPSCLKNYLAMGSIGWELLQLNSIPWQIWLKLGAMVTLDFATLGFDGVELNMFLVLG